MDVEGMDRFVFSCIRRVVIFIVSNNFVCVDVFIRGMWINEAVVPRGGRDVELITNRVVDAIDRGRIEVLLQSDGWFEVGCLGIGEEGGVG